MTYIVLTDGSAWFDIDKAKMFNESFAWNGRDSVSRATRSKWEHEALYKTSTGRWVLKHWNELDATEPTYGVINDKEAYAWLFMNHYFGAIPQEESHEPDVETLRMIYIPDKVWHQAQVKVRQKGMASISEYLLFLLKADIEE